MSNRDDLIPQLYYGDTSITRIYMILEPCVLSSERGREAAGAPVAMFYEYEPAVRTFEIYESNFATDWSEQMNTGYLVSYDLNSRGHLVNQQILAIKTNRDPKPERVSLWEMGRRY